VTLSAAGPARIPSLLPPTFCLTQLGGHFFHLRKPFGAKTEPTHLDSTGATRPVQTPFSERLRWAHLGLRRVQLNQRRIEPLYLVEIEERYAFVCGPGLHFDGLYFGAQARNSIRESKGWGRTQTASRVMI
jgi:hypothetical protein